MSNILHADRIERLRRDLARPDHDACHLHDELRRLADDITQSGCPLPADLREALAEAEAEILEDFHDNLPV